MTTKRIKKSNFYTENKKIFNIDDIDVIRTLCLRLPQMNSYAKKFNENAKMSFRVNNKQLLKNYN